MFDVGFWELALIGVIALLVVGPERLPALARNVGLWVGRMRRYVAHVREDIEREIHADEVRKLMETPADTMGELNEALTETRSVFKDAEEQLTEAEREGWRYEDEIEKSLEADSGETETPEASATEVSEAGPFEAGNNDLLNPDDGLASDGAEAADNDEEQRHAKS